MGLDLDPPAARCSADGHTAGHSDTFPHCPLPLLPLKRLWRKTVGKGQTQPSSGGPGVKNTFRLGLTRRTVQ